MRTTTQLAIAGGPSAVPPGSHRRWPEITAADRAALTRVLDRGVLWGPNAPEVTALEEEWAAYVGTCHCLLVNSGTAALHGAVVGAGIGPGDEVIVPAFSFVATPMAVLHAGAVPVFCDIDPRSFTLDARLMEERIGERTRGVMPVHVHGLPADMEEIRTVAARHGLAVIEDAAQAHGARYRGVRAGALADSAAFSLNGSKLLPGGEGGLYVTDSDEAMLAARRLAIFGEDTPSTEPPRYRSYWAHGTGWNYRAHEFTAALARAQMRGLDDRVATAQRNAQLLNAGLAGLPGLEPPHVPDDRTCSFYRYRVRLHPEDVGFSGSSLEFRDRVLWALQAEGVAADLWQLLPLPAQSVFRRARLGPWQPGTDAEPLAPWDPGEHPEAARLLESSIVLGTAEAPLFGQPSELMSSYLAAFRKVIDDIAVVLTSDYRAVEPWPPRQPPL
jgi:dTDP-4-amino-4,6-dideoxygalactose transaminase